MQLRTAQRKQSYMKLGIQAPSGCGKTYSSLLLAKGIIGDLTKVAIIDSEKSADLYAHLGNYQVLTLEPPFAPKKYIKAIEVCKKANMELVIIDSLSHAWMYIKDYHSGMSGNSFQNWSKLKPIHQELIDTIIQTPIHFICNFRTKHDYVMTEKNGKIVPEKKGLKAVTTDDTEYEFSIVFDLDTAHQATVSKDRTGLFAPLKVPFLITEATGKQIKDWCETGVSVEEITQLILKASDVDELNNIYRNHKEFYPQLEDVFKQQKAKINNNYQILNHSENGNTTN
jgi:hypothetical protein